VNKRLIVSLAVFISLCTLTLTGEQIKWMQAITRAEEESFARHIRLALEEVADEAEKQETETLLLHGYPARLFQSRTQQITLSHLPLEKRLPLQTLDSLLKEAFRKKDILIPYDFAVTDETGTILFETTGFKDATPVHTYSARLFPNDPDESFAHYLSVYLAHYASHILRSTRWMIIVSVILTLLIAATFATTLIIIFRQKKLSEIKNDFVNNITHELKTPITTISLAAQMMEDRSVPDWESKIPRLSRLIGSESKRLSLWVENILQSAVFERGKLKLRAKPVDLQQLLQNVLAQFTLQFEELHADIQYDLHATHTRVMGDEIHLANVISNLIDNAIKYRKETEPLQLLVKTENEHSHITLSITDNGIGIDGHESKHLFDRFYRTPSSNGHTVKGFGLGLYYVKNIIETHNGKLFAFGKTGKGSTFGFTLPLCTTKTN
jgi:two-component system phosphate regulon sensor histidine kinase PhoR